MRILIERANVIILLTNDDGIEAEGLALLEHSVAQLFPTAEVWVVAPDGPRSQCGHAVITETIETRRLGDRRLAVGGYPADCVRVALFGLGLKPEWIFSGINHGGNMGQDIVISGTAAAAREGAYHGVASCAVSQFIDRKGMSWENASDLAAAALADITTRELGDAFWNVNLPPVAKTTEVVHCEPARSPLPAEYEEEPTGQGALFRYKGIYQQRTRDTNSDVDICFGGRIAVSRIPVHPANGSGCQG